MHAGLLPHILGPAVGAPTLRAIVLYQGNLREWDGTNGALVVLDATTGGLKTAAAGTALVFDKTNARIRQASAGETVLHP